MTQSVELLLDEATEAAVRAQWDALDAAGLPSQARHQGPSNRPHVTLAAREHIDPISEPALREAVSVLPLTLRLGTYACFGRDRFVLVRLVVADRALLDLQMGVTDVLGDEPGGCFGPGCWTPHVTLAHRMRPGQVGQALAVLGDARESDARAVGCRRWDSVARRVWALR
ncbi:MAG: 2'-5' RNA ligase family protein [Actinomycetota bacterium]|nr:2'-5' RNA ligase family protein [Actinomycetota bacterium]